MPIPMGGIYNDEMRSLGEIVEHLPDEQIGSFAAEAEILFGSGVARGATPTGAKVMSAATDDMLGVAAKSFSASRLDDDIYSINDPVGVVRKGIVVVYVEEAVKPGDKVRVRHGAAAGKAAGSFCKTAEVGKTAVVEHAEFRSETAAAGVAALWISGPLKLVAD